MPFHLWPDAGSPTRREFLAGLALGGIAIAGARGAVADEAAWFALVSDVHIPSDSQFKARGQSPVENLRVVVADILASPTKPAGVLIDGDLALKEGLPGDYSTLLSVLAPLRKAGIPLHFALGNHDARGAFREAVRGMIPLESKVDEKLVGIVDALGHRLVILDSLDKTDGVPGRLGNQQVAWLMRDLDAHRERPTLVFVHHNPRSVGGSGLLDDDSLFAAIKPRPWVKAVVFGHTHRWTHSSEEGLHLVNLPAVAYPFQPDQPLGYCRLRIAPGGATVELRDVIKKAATPGEMLSLAWRT